MISRLRRIAPRLRLAILGIAALTLTEAVVTHNRMSDLIANRKRTNQVILPAIREGNVLVNALDELAEPGATMSDDEVFEWVGRAILAASTILGYTTIPAPILNDTRRIADVLSGLAPLLIEHPERRQSRAEALQVDAAAMLRALGNDAIAHSHALQAKIEGTKRLLIEYSLLMLAILAGVTIVFERQINRRLDLIARAINEIANETFENEQIPVGGSDEISDIGNMLELLRKRTSALRDYAYASAHDMRTPLLTIEQLAEWAIEDAEAEGVILPEASRECLDRILTSAGRLAQLQADMLDYAMAEHIDATVVPLDIGEIVREIHLLHDPKGHFPLNIDGAPDELIALPLVPLRRVLSNLLSNAIRHHDRDHGKINVSVKLASDRVLIIVADDGPGIEPRYHDRVFERFARLTRQDKVSGSGLGLSLATRVIEARGGSVTLHSDPSVSRGTMFVIALPI